MEKSSAFKEEIYKIVKYQTKLASSNNIKETEMYRNKLNEHVQKMKMFGGSGSNVLNMVGGTLSANEVQQKKTAMEELVGKIKQKRETVSSSAKSTIDGFKTILTSHFDTTKKIVDDQKALLDKHKVDLSKKEDEHTACVQKTQEQEDSIAQISAETQKLRDQNNAIEHLYVELENKLQAMLTEEPQQSKQQDDILKEINELATEQIHDLKSASGIEQQQ